MVLINFNTKVFNTCSWINSFTTELHFYYIIKPFPFRFKYDHFSFFFTVSGILFAISQLTSLHKSMFSNLLGFLIDLSKYNKLVSSIKFIEFYGLIKVIDI